MGRACAPAACCFISTSYTARHLIGISVGIDSNRRRKLLYIQMVMALVGYRPGAPQDFIPVYGLLELASSFMFSEPRPYHR
jgi:hypothetical protein